MDMPTNNGSGNCDDYIPLAVAGLIAVACAPSLCLVGAGIVGGLWAWKQFN